MPWRSYDPEAVGEAFRVGVGGRFDAEIGGKSDSLHGDPVRIQGRVKLLYDGKYIETAARHGGMRYLDQGSYGGPPNREFERAGRELRTAQQQAPPAPSVLGQLTSAGIQPQQLRVIVVKAAVAFRAAYEPIAGTIIPVGHKRPHCSEPRRFTYTKARRDLFVTGLARGR